MKLLSLKRSLVYQAKPLTLSDLKQFRLLSPYYQYTKNSVFKIVLHLSDWY